MSLGQAPQNARPRSLMSRLGALADMYAYPLRLSHYMELVNPLWAAHSLQARVEDVWDETPGARTLTLKPGRNWPGHRAGQHLWGWRVGGWRTAMACRTTAAR